MKPLNKNVNKESNCYRSLVATALLTGSLFQMIAPVLAEGTAGGQTISNTATATYEDPNDPNTKINATSNTVIVTVAEVAGITVTAAGLTDSTPADPVKVGDKIFFNFTVTNVGNDPTKFRIPDLAKVTGPGTASKLEYSTDGGTTWIPLPGTEYTTDSIPVNGSILVRVPVTVTGGAANDQINVTLGDTPGNAQNQLRNTDGGDVYTVDNPDGTAGDVVGSPVNGTREASATQQVSINQSVKTYALATILKTRSDYSNVGTTAINDDKLTYDLSLKVELNDPTGNQITAAPLAGTTINGFADPRILVSDAIPKDTELAAIPTPPLGWQVIFTDQPVSINAKDATWKPLTTATPLSSVTRIGYVNDPAVFKTLAPGTTVNNFKVPIKVKSTVTATSLTVENIAQLFGQTSGSTTPVYDESGDKNPSNFNDDGTPPAGTDTNGDKIPDTLPSGSIDKGYVDNPGTLPPADIDGGNNNSGKGTGGEPNQFKIDTPVATAIINGPEGVADAIGPTGNNDDFTNKSSLVPPDKSAPGSLLDPAPVGFTNTVKNSGTSKNNLSLIPTPPANPADLPPNTVVTITYGSQSISYVWTGTEFKFDADKNPATPGDQTAIDAITKYITIPNVDPGVSVNYGVEVNLPDGTKLSTDLDKGFPVPITAFIDDTTPGLGTETAKNITIDRVYTGFLKMLKESRVLPGSGPAVQGTDGTFSAGPKKPAPGNIIEYQIRYKNISEAQAGSGNVILNADKVVIVEDGTLSNSPGDNKNNWAVDNDGNGQIDTSNIVGSAKDSGATTINFYSGKPATNAGNDQTGTTVETDVTKYINTVTNKVTPGEERKFIFQRKVN